MKQLKISVLLFLLGIISFTSCKKGAVVIDPDNSATRSVIEFANTGSDVGSASASHYPRFAIDLGTMALGDTVGFNINVSYSGADAAPQDITVNIGIDTAALRIFNTDNSTSYVAPPTGIVSFPTTAIIPKGAHQVTLRAVVTLTSSYDFGVNYALPLGITSTTLGTISGNYGKALYSFSARNNFDGIYLMSATSPMVDLTSSSLTGWYPINMQLITYTGNSIALYDGINYTSAYGHPIRSGTGYSYYGTFSPVFYFDTDGTIYQVKNYYGDNAGSNKRSAELNPAGTNKATFNADGTIQSFEVSYIMTQSVTTANAPRTYFYEKFTYVEPR